jgi:hypothetical protein
MARVASQQAPAPQQVHNLVPLSKSSSSPITTKRPPLAPPLRPAPLPPNAITPEKRERAINVVRNTVKRRKSITYKWVKICKNFLGKFCTECVSVTQYLTIPEGRQQKKRQALCKEIIDTEINFNRLLSFLVQVKNLNPTKFFSQTCL